MFLATTLGVILDTKLKPLYRESTFWVLLVISLPGIIASYKSAMNGVTPDMTALLASPLAIYLGIGRQYARGKAVENAAVFEFETPDANDPLGPDGIGEMIPGYEDDE